ncbi:hypothetical protein L210DRAFT_2766329 [Boletus edulis BED1]|uniref:Uncharacterized protein n=1 Tax=Boletus edulis BED1 TaxID=1328754 RepID=A0AAD4G9W4_BOLED|nr:hypothetical protein L210DRAFT_2766329 [Boletus edulis BED1]
MPRHSTRINGLSKSISDHSFKRGNIRRTTILHARDQASRMQRAAQQRTAEVQLLTPEDQDLVDSMMQDHGMPIAFDDVPGGEIVGVVEPDIDTDEEDEFRGLAEGFSGWCPIDDRDRRDRIELQTEHWTTQMPRLVDAYLEYCSRDSGDGFPPLDDAEPPLLPSSGTINNIELVDLFGTPSLPQRKPYLSRIYWLLSSFSHPRYFHPDPLSFSPSASNMSTV